MDARVDMGWLLTITICLFVNYVQYSSGQTTQQDIDYFANNVKVRYEVLDNWVYGADRHLLRLTLRNAGSVPIQKGDWQMFFCNIREIANPSSDADPAHIPETYGVRITHINGCLHRFETLNTFPDILPDSELKINITAKFWLVARLDVMPNWYVTAENLVPRTIVSTAGESLDFVAPIFRAEQWSRYKIETDDFELIDKYHPYLPSERYERNDIEDMGEEAVRHNVIPTPKLMQLGNGYVHIGTGDWVIAVTPRSAGLQPAANYLAELTGMIIRDSIPSRHAIEFRMITTTGPGIRSDESYELEVNSVDNYVTISASTKEGALHGVQTLRHLADDQWSVPAVSIQDSPRFAYRGMHLDVARNFFGKETVMAMLDTMSRYKLNKFHIHLSDDEGWRLEIPDLPELTSIGSKRCHDLDERRCLIPQLGSGHSDQTSGSGHYTMDDYREILRHAAKLNIEVIPEFDSPGHARAQIKAMLARYENLGGATGGASATEFLLQDLNDTSKYLTPQFFTDDAINPCLESTYKFIETVIKRVVSLHVDTNPLKTFHFGGDEVGQGAWENSTQCQQLMARRPDLNSRDSLKAYFAQRVIGMANSIGVNAAGWEDGLLDKEQVPYDRTQLGNRDVYAYAWQNIWEWGVGDRAYRLANAGYKVVMSHATHLYFDHAEEPDPEERGYYWATRFSDTHKVFGFMPEHLYWNADRTRAGYPVTTEMLCGPTNSSCTPLTAPSNIVGMQGQLWSEILRTPDQMESKLLPRMLALAERAWHKASWEDIPDKSKRSREQRKDWTKFANTLGYFELAKLDKMGMDYGIPPPGAKINSAGRLLVNSAFPGLVVEYSTDDGDNWYRNVDQACPSGRILLRTRSADERRTSRVVLLDPPVIFLVCASPYHAANWYKVIVIAAIAASRRFIASI